MDDSIWDEAFNAGAWEVINRVSKWLDEDTLDYLKEQYKRR